MADAYLVEVTMPGGDVRREIYRTLNGAEQATAMYARSPDGWKTTVFPLFRLPDAGDSLPQRGPVDGA